MVDSIENRVNNELVYLMNPNNHETNRCRTMKVEFEVRDQFGKDGRSVYGELLMSSVMSAFGNFLLTTMDETIYNVIINGKDFTS